MIFIVLTFGESPKRNVLEVSLTLCSNRNLFHWYFWRSRVLVRTLEDCIHRECPGYFIADFYTNRSKVFLILLGLVIDLGGVPGTPRIGFRYWNNPGPFVEYIGSGAWGRFLGYWAVMSNAVFSFAGVESIAMAAAETRNPRIAIPKACKRVFARVAIFYILAVLIVGMLVSSDDPRLDDESGTAAQSPFVIAASAAGLNGVPSLVNAIVITSAWSSSNQALLAGTRVLYGLALKNQAPKIFLRTTSWGVPYMCVLLNTAFMFLAFMR